jgi:ATP-binding cassette subfamily B protein
MVTQTIDKKQTRKTSQSNPTIVTEKYNSAGQWFWSGLVRYPGLMFSSFLLILLNAGITILPSILFGVAIDVLINTGYGSSFIILVVAIIGVALLSWATSFSSSYLWGIASYRFERDIRQEFYDIMQEHSMAFHDKHDSGKLLSMVMNETNQIRMAFHPSLRHLINSLLNVILTCIYLFIRVPVPGGNVIGVGSWEIGLAISFAFVIYLVLAWRYARRVGPIRRDLAEELSNVSSATQETFRGIEVVRSFDNEEKEKEKFRYYSNRLADKTKEEGYLSSFYWPALIMVFITGGALGVGLWFVARGPQYMTYGQLTTMLTQLISLVSLNFMIPTRLLMLQAGLINASRIWDIMTFDDPLIEPTTSEELNWSKNLIFDHVSFCYPGTTKKVLNKISFQIPPGSRVVILGGPGSGKSTILKLLLRLYDPTEGTIGLNGIDFKTIDTAKIREDVTLVEQDIFLFAASIRDNIAFSKPDATDEEILLAAKRAQILPFIQASPDGLDTIVGERGVTLSGGQKQRIAIARALLADPKLLLLDDSTSAVDIKTEVRLRVAMEELIKGRTSIIVTQRLSTLVDADMIIFLKQGKVIDIGTHEQLLLLCEEYQFMMSLLPTGSEMIKQAAKKVSSELEGGMK